MSKPTILAPSILSADLANLANEIKKIEDAHADWIHVDVMDGRFVPNLTMGIPVVASLKKQTKLPLDVHLMIVEPERYVNDFVKAGATVLTIHAEATSHLYRTLNMIREAGIRSGVALNPATPLCMIEHVLTEVDQVVIMTVEPGFGGQKFLESMLVKISALCDQLKQRRLPVDILVDGGINRQTIAKAAAAGARIFVAGDAVFKSGDVAQAIAELRTALQAVVG